MDKEKQGAEFKVGDNVTYMAPHGEKEHGVVKSVQSAEYVFVVYKCGGEWNRYTDYAAARTDTKSLKTGWV